jgi:hypothetical protein
MYPKTLELRIVVNGNMATPTKSIDYRLKYPELHHSLRFRFGIFKLKKIVVLMFVLSALTFIAALYYVEQQVRLRTLNYEIIELKTQKNLLLEQHKTLQLQLDQSKRLDKIEEEMKRRGFVPVAEGQIRIVQ